MTHPEPPAAEREDYSRYADRCWTESGAHLFRKESGGAWVCQVCGDLKPTAGRGAADGTP